MLLDSSVRRPGRVALALAALLLAAGCIISPKPEPPAAGASLDPGRVTTVDSRQGTGTDVGSLLCVSGEPGSASPPGATVRIYNLDSTAPPVETVVRQDGSFSAQLPGEPHRVKPG